MGLLYVLRRLKSLYEKKDLIMVYNNVIRSRLEYCCCAFVGELDNCFKKFKTLQRYAHNIICYTNCHCKILSALEEKRKNHVKKLFHSIAKDDKHILKDIIPDVLTHCHKYKLNLLRYKCSQKQFVPFMTAMIKDCK